MSVCWCNKPEPGIRVGFCTRESCNFNCLDDGRGMGMIHKLAMQTDHRDLLPGMMRTMKMMMMMIIIIVIIYIMAVSE